MQPNEFKYFAEEEFAKCTPPCKLSDMDRNFMLRLDGLRAVCGFAFVLNSCYRSKSYELKHHRSGDSYHTLGRAVDIRCLDGKKRAKIIQYAPAFGLRGIGVSNRYIHLDDRDFNCIWAYD